MPPHDDLPPPPIPEEGDLPPPPPAAAPAVAQRGPRGGGLRGVPAAQPRRSTVRSAAMDMGGLDEDLPPPPPDFEEREGGR